MKQFEINSGNAGQRFDKYLNRIVGNGGMSFIYKMLRKKNFTLNDKKATGKEILKAGDIIRLYISDDTYEKFKTDSNIDEYSSHGCSSDYDIDKLIIYEDSDIILFNKPEGMLSQKAAKGDKSVNEYLNDYLIEKGMLTGEQLLEYKPSVVNRLDRNTTGIIIFAKTLKSARVISESLKERTVLKYYKCAVQSEFNREGKYTGFLTKNKSNNTVRITDTDINADSEYIETEYKLLHYDREADVSILEVHLITGKSHQIRAHLSYMGFPIIGDRKYGNSQVNGKYKAKNQLLHAYKIIFPKYDENFGFDFSGKEIICEPQFRY